MDGTLLNSKKKVSDRSINILLKCAEYGVKLIIATARPPRSVKSMIPPELLSKCAAVYYNGALYDISPDVCRHYPITSAINQKLLRYCLREPDAKISIEVRDQWYSFHEIDHKSLGIMTGPEYITMDDIKDLEPTKILISGLNDIKGLQAGFENDLNIVITDSGALIQVMASNVSKETAVQEICNHFQINLSEVIVFGDDYNDVGLFKICGYSVAMQNGIEELKRLATEVTETNDNDGVAVVLERLFVL